jgi:hypothetical protein
MPRLLLLWTEWLYFDAGWRLYPPVGCSVFFAGGIAIFAVKAGFVEAVKDGIETTSCGLL